MQRPAPSQAYRALLLSAVALLSGCAATVYTVDDGSPVDETLLANIRTYGKGQQLLRPNIVKTAELKDKDCSTQYELPFVTASSYDLPKEKKIAWARGLHVDERLTIIAAAPDSGVAVGDHIEDIDGFKRENAEKMLEELNNSRDFGHPFTIRIAGAKGGKDGKSVTITPIEVCRGHVNLAAPEAEIVQDYHWLQSTHPLSLFTQDVTPDEAMWMVLWTQGLSEEAGARMKTYRYGMGMLKTGITIASIASGVGAVANAASTAAAQVAATQAGHAAAQAALQAAGKAAAEQAASAMRQKAIDALQTVVKQKAQEVAMDSVKAATIFKDSLSGISWAASTGFYMADQWALDRMAKMGVDQIAAYTLHFKLASNSLSQNAFVFDEERLKLVTAYAEKNGMGDKVELVLNGSDKDADPATLKAIRQKKIPIIRVAVGDTTFEGQFVLDSDQRTYSGNGKVSWGNGDVYEGDLKAGKRTGIGRMTWANGQTYDGAWADDAATGAGKVKFQNGDRYDGAVIAGVPNGLGSMKYASGDHYDGEFAGGTPDGQGKYEWASGDQYEGQWKRNVRDGRGIFTWKSGDNWTGVFKDGTQTAEGVLTRHTDAAAPVLAEVEGQKSADASTVKDAK